MSAHGQPLWALALILALIFSFAAVGGLIGERKDRRNGK